jgi:hypothetical protein
MFNLQSIKQTNYLKINIKKDILNHKMHIYIAFFYLYCIISKKVIFRLPYNGISHVTNTILTFANQQKYKYW